MHLAADVLVKEPSLLELDYPPNGFVVVGDLHGEMDTLLAILEEYGFPPNNNYIFLGELTMTNVFPIRHGDYNSHFKLTAIYLQIKYKTLPGSVQASTYSKRVPR